MSSISYFINLYIKQYRVHSNIMKLITFCVIVTALFVIFFLWRFLTILIKYNNLHSNVSNISIYISVAFGFFLWLLPFLFFLCEITRYFDLSKIKFNKFLLNQFSFLSDDELPANYIYNNKIENQLLTIKLLFENKPIYSHIVIDWKKCGKSKYQISYAKFSSTLFYIVLARIVTFAISETIKWSQN